MNYAYIYILSQRISIAKHLEFIIAKKTVESMVPGVISWCTWMSVNTSYLKTWESVLIWATDNDFDAILTSKILFY